MMKARMAEQFDMFSEEVPRDHVVTRDISKHAKPEQPTVSMSRSSGVPAFPRDAVELGVVPSRQAQIQTKHPAEDIHNDPHDQKQ